MPPGVRDGVRGTSSMFVRQTWAPHRIQETPFAVGGVSHLIDFERAPLLPRFRRLHLLPPQWGGQCGGLCFGQPRSSPIHPTFLSISPSLRRSCPPHFLPLYIPPPSTPLPIPPPRPTTTFLFNRDYVVSYIPQLKELPPQFPNSNNWPQPQTNTRYSPQPLRRKPLIPTPNLPDNTCINPLRAPVP